ncbi:hypothetical protein COU74_03980 [Candidatus Peregrinibacteria bacterium CG10_big_fil_rev_8_21_14_0_10_36_19]|nr:MAG: hypothetical protein COU74_03980 [Candidatus Peregrinibacteria bacterium CG10_big_fil_rev_8_21_14_0_10_36_19]
MKKNKFVIDGVEYKDCEYLTRGGCAHLYRSVDSVSGLPVVIKDYFENLDPRFKLRLAACLERAVGLEVSGVDIVTPIRCEIREGVLKHSVMKYVYGEDLGDFDFSYSVNLMGMQDDVGFMRNFFGRNFFKFLESLMSNYFIYRDVSDFGYSIDLESIPEGCDSLRKFFVRNIFGVLEFLMSQGLVHRDVKPSNVMFDYIDNRFLLLDCDFITEVDASTDGFVFGTPPFMAPEHLCGNLHITNDVFGLASTLADILGLFDDVGLAHFGGGYHRRCDGLFSEDRDEVENVKAGLRKMIGFPESQHREVAGLVEFMLAGLNINPNARPKTMEEVDQLLDFVPNLSMV